MSHSNVLHNIGVDTIKQIDTFLSNISEISPDVSVEMLEMRPYNTDAESCYVNPETIMIKAPSLSHHSFSNVPDQTFNVNVYYEELGFRNFTVTGRSPVSSICEKALNPLNPGQKVQLNDYNVVAFDDDGNDRIMDLNMSIEHIFNKEKMLSRFIVVASRPDAHLFPVPIKLPNGSTKSLNLSVFSPVKVAIRKIRDEVKLTNTMETLALFKSNTNGGTFIIQEQVKSNIDV